MATLELCKTSDVDEGTAKKVETGGLVLAGASLTLPHPRMHQRAFVLRPLLEIDPDATIAGLGAAAHWLDRCLDQPVERLGGWGLVTPATQEDVR